MSVCLSARKKQWLARIKSFSSIALIKKHVQLTILQICLLIAGQFSLNVCYLSSAFSLSVSLF